MSCVINNDKILIELIQNQRKNIPVDKKLTYNDLKRLSKYLNNSIFGDSCSLWSGYVTIIKNEEKNSYINFYFNGKKNSLHRILYTNYIGDIQESEYIKSSCANKGKCCNVNHFYKNNKSDNNEQLETLSAKNNTINNEPRKIIVDFTL